MHHGMCHWISICVEASHVASFQLPLLDGLLFHICLLEQGLTLHPSQRPAEHCILDGELVVQGRVEAAGSMNIRSLDSKLLKSLSIEHT